jgi:hypothetical protein
MDRTRINVLVDRPLPVDAPTEADQVRYGCQPPSLAMAVVSLNPDRFLRPRLELFGPLDSDSEDGTWSYRGDERYPDGEESGHIVVVARTERPHELAIPEDDNRRWRELIGMGEFDRAIWQVGTSGDRELDHIACEGSTRDTSIGGTREGKEVRQLARRGIEPLTPVRNRHVGQPVCQHLRFIWRAIEVGGHALSQASRPDSAKHQL